MKIKNFFSKLHWQVAAALVLAIVFAFGFKAFGLSESVVGNGFERVCSFIGSLFMRMLSMIVVPLVATSVICGSMSLGKGRTFLRVGLKTLAFYLITGLMAILLALLLVNAIAPGDVSAETARKILGGANFDASAVNSGAGDIVGVLLRFFPPNIVEAASDNTQLLGLIVFAVIIGVFINTLPEKHAEFQRKFWSSFNILFEKITNAIMRLLPIGVFGLVAPVFMRAGAEAVAPVVVFFLTVSLALVLHSVGTMSLVLLSAGVNPVKHLKAMLPAILTAFSTSSSVARVPKNISGFTIPLGATVNMNGSALYECVAVIFISQIYASAGGAAMGIGMQFLVVVLALLTSIGVAGIPSASLVAIVVIMGVAGIPAEAVGIIWMTDRILDMMRTSVNIYGDSCAAVWVAATEKHKVYTSDVD